MAAAPNLQSPRGPGDAAHNSPKSSRRRGVSSPWTQIVRGPESEPVVSVPAPVVAPQSPVTPPPSRVAQEQVTDSCSDWKSVEEPVDNSLVESLPESSDNGGNASKKPAWNKPSNGSVDVSPLMGAVSSWPALSESTKASPKSSSSDSLKALADVSLPAVQVTGNSSSSSPHKQVVANNANAAAAAAAATTTTTTTTTTNHVVPTRQRSMKRGGGTSVSVSSNGGLTQPPSQDAVVEVAPNTPGKSGSSVVESSPRDYTHKESPRGGFGSQSQNSNDHQHQRNSFKRGNGGRGDGSYHHNYGGKRDQDRGNQEWNTHNRSFGNRDAHLQSPRGFSRPFIRPPIHTTTPFIPSPVPVPVPVPVRPFGNPIVYPDMASPLIYVQGPAPPESLRVMPIVAPMPPHPIFFPVMDPELQAKIVSQIDYYFSNDNLIKDTYLRQNMDDQGWVPIKLIAGFKKVSNLTNNIPLILDFMQTSNVVEVQGDKVRKRNDWMRWIMPPPIQFGNVSSPRTPGRSSPDMLASQIHSVTLDEKRGNQGLAETYFSRSSSGEFSSQLQHSGGEKTGQGQFSGQAGFEPLQMP